MGMWQSVTPQHVTLVEDKVWEREVQSSPYLESQLMASAKTCCPSARHEAQRMGLIVGPGAWCWMHTALKTRRTSGAQVRPHRQRQPWLVADRHTGPQASGCYSDPDGWGVPVLLRLGF